MNTIKLVMLGLIAACSATSLLAHADKNSCPPFVLHCAYMTGVSDALNDGRYIKVANNKIGSITTCFNGTSTVFLEQLEGHKFMGPNADTYSICSDSQGSHCEQIGVDKFLVSAKDGEYSSTPMLYNIDITAFKDKYAACDSFAGNRLKR